MKCTVAFSSLSEHLNRAVRKGGAKEEGERCAVVGRLRNNFDHLGIFDVQ